MINTKSQLKLIITMLQNDEAMYYLNSINVSINNKLKW